MLQAIAGALREGITNNDKQNLSGEMTVEVSGENRSINISKTAQGILKLLKASPTMTIPELAQELQVSTRTIERQVSQLQKLGLLERVGSTKAGSWLVC